jgi:hypothetical protein
VTSVDVDDPGVLVAESGSLWQQGLVQGQVGQVR